MIVIACPGQGSQTPGFLSPWLELDGMREHLEGLSDSAKVDLVRHGTESDADTIRDTAIAQPLIVAASIVTGIALRLSHGDRFGALAGHSVGEFAAASLAGAISEDQALEFVGIRGRAMAAEARSIATGMYAVIGGDAADLAARLDELGLYAANMNGGGQVVVAGELAALERLAAEPVAGSRVIPLQVAGAFHTRYMEGAVATLRDATAGTPTRDPFIPLYTNKDGSRVASGADYLDLLVGQVSNPVRWDLCMESFERDGITGFIELAPGGALAGLVKRGIKGIPTVAIKTPGDLETAVELLEAS